MEKEIKETIEIVKTEIRVFTLNGKQSAEVVMLDEKGTEYRVEGKVYIHGTYGEVEPTIIATDKPTPK